MSNETHIGGDSYGPVATGPHASAVQYGSAPTIGSGADLRDAIARLRDLITEHAAGLPESTRALRDVDELSREVEEPDPDPQRIRDATSRIVNRAGAVTVIAAAIDQVRQLLDGLLN